MSTLRLAPTDRMRLRSAVAAAYEAGDTVRAIADRHNLSYKLTLNLLREARVTMRPRGHNFRGPGSMALRHLGEEQQRKLLQDLTIGYVDGHLSCSELGLLYGLQSGMVRRLLRSAGVHRIPRSTPAMPSA